MNDRSASGVDGRRAPQAPADPRGEVSPYFIARVSGAPVEGVEAMRAEAAVDALKVLERAEMEAVRLGDALVERLHAAVGRAEGKRARRRLLALKRDAHNGRAIDEATRVAAGELLEPPDARALAAYVEAMRERERLLARCEAAYVEARDRARQALWRAVEAPAFRNGLLLASPTLHARMERAWQEGLADASETDVHSRTWRRLRKLERGLLRYLTRMAMKATPFGMFCSVVDGRFENETARRDPGNGPRRAVVRFDGDPSPTRSVVRLNKRLCAPLIRQLTARPAVRRHFEVELTPTLRVGEEAFEFLADSLDGELFQRMPCSPALHLVRSLLPDGRRARLAELVEEVCAAAGPRSPAGKIEEYLVTLLDRGFLRYRSPVHEQDPDWDRPLEAFCRSVDDHHARAVGELLRGLRDGLERYRRAGPDERAGILEEARGLVFDTAAEVGLRKDRIQSRIFYEDATADARLVVGVGRDDPAFRDLIEFARLISKVASPRAEQATTRAFFDRTYEAGASVPLLDFNEDYHRRHLHEHREREERARQGRSAADDDGYDLANPFGVPLVAAIQEASKRLSRLIAERWAESPDAEEIRITPEEVAEALADVPPATDGLCRSFGAFVEVLPGRAEGDATSLLLHRAGFLPGYGKYLSRFVCLLPDRVCAGVYARNAGLSGARLAEIPGDGGFNANLHPPLLPWEIGYPTEESAAGGDRRLDAGHLRVEADPADPHGLRLAHAPLGERVLPIDLGFQTATMRPALHQLLSELTPAARFWVAVPNRPHVPGASGDGAAGASEATAPDGPSVLHRPRIVFGRRVILARRAWLLSQEAFPAPDAGEPDAAYFRRVRTWRAAHGLPRECYVRVVSAARGAAGRRADAAAGGSGGAEVEIAPPDSEQAVEGSPAGSGAAFADEAGEESDAGAEEDGVRTAPSSDFYKPQYVDFDSPLLVDLFGRAPGSLGTFTAIVEERLPEAAGIPHRPNGAHAVELLVEVDFPEPTVAASSNGGGA